MTTTPAPFRSGLLVLLGTGAVVLSAVAAPSANATAIETNCRGTMGTYQGTVVDGVLTEVCCHDRTNPGNAGRQCDVYRNGVLTPNHSPQSPPKPTHKLPTPATPSTAKPIAR